MLIVTTHVSRSTAPKRRSVLDHRMVSKPPRAAASRGRSRLALMSQLAFVRDTRPHPAAGGGGGEPTGGMFGASAGAAGGGGDATYTWAGTHAQK